MPKESEKRIPATAWEKKGVNIQTINKELIRQDRETCIEFYETSKFAVIDTANKTLQNRVESLGIEPIQITKFRIGRAECRMYNIPRKMLQLPSNRKRKPKGTPKTRLSAEVWEERGVGVSHWKTYTIDKDERETGIHWLETDKVADIYTDNRKMQNRIESLGIKPYKITTYKNTTIDSREYKVPKEWMQMPTSGSRKKKED